MFIPTTIEEANERGWKRFDIILVIGDAYIDSPFMGASIIGHVLLDAGYRVGIIAQPDMKSGIDIGRLGEPLFFWGVSGGSVDSLISNYTATGKKRMGDDLTPGGRNNRRPDRAVIAYTNLIRRHFKNTAPIVIGGIEASLRRIAHYDYRDNSIRRSVIFDAKGDILVYGMGERAALELAGRLKTGLVITEVPGICYISDKKIENYIELPSFEAVSSDKMKFQDMYDIFYRNNDPVKAVGLVQKHGNRYLIHNPPARPLSEGELDRVHGLPYERDLHPYYKSRGGVRALDTIRFSITTHRGCFGGCNYCAITVHQGISVVSRSEKSILKEVRAFTKHPAFKGIISDVGGATANMYGISCKKMTARGACADRSCLAPKICSGLQINHQRQISLLRSIRKVPGIKKAFVASGIRHDLVMADRKAGESYLSEIVRFHVSGQLKVAPEHCMGRVLGLMGRPPAESLIAFRDLFSRLSRRFKKKQYLTYYFIAAHPGCTHEDMIALKKFAAQDLHLLPEQVQIFTPAPLTWSALMYYTGIDPFTGNKIFVERDRKKKEEQKRALGK